MELKSLLDSSRDDPSLLSSIRQTHLKQRNRPHAFFAFPGLKGSMMSLPPFQKWPIQFGWSFSTWFYLEPKSCAQPHLYNFKTGKSGLGYSAHFMGNCLVLTSIRVKGKGVQHCVAYEFPSNKWIHCAITYHNKWRASGIKVYVNGQLTANIEMPWQVQTTEMFDKCFIGGSGSLTGADRSGDINSFSGQMSALYLFNEGLSPTQICAIHRLGPSYMGQFKYSNESHVNLPPQISRTLYEEKLASTLFCLFTPVAVDSGTLCIQLAPFKSSTSASAQNYFLSAPHAALLGETIAIVGQPICSTLQSLGCSRTLLPLLDVFADQGNPEACTSLVGFLCDLLESSPHWFANEIVQNNGFVMVACALASDSRLLLSEQLLDTFLNLARTLLSTSSTPGDSLLLKHLMDNILFNPSLWIYARPELQVKLYNYLATEFLTGTKQGSNKYTISSSPNQSSSYVAYNPTSTAASALHSSVQRSNSSGGSGGVSNQDDNQQAPRSLGGATTSTFSASHEMMSSPLVADLLFGEIRRVSTVLQSLHALKYYYWVVEEQGINHKARNYKLRPSQSELMVIRSHILALTKELIGHANTAPLDEVQGLLNYLSACSQPENLLDALETLSELIVDHPSSMIAALDQKQAIRVLFTLIGSRSEQVRIKSIRLLSLFLGQCSNKKKQDIMGPSNLFMLLCDRLRVVQPLSLELYEALIDLMIEENNPGRQVDERRSFEISKKRIENSMVIKVLATLIHEEQSGHNKHHSRSEAFSNKDTAHNDQQLQQQANCGNRNDIRNIFINDLWNLIVNNRENRRIILQMSVWQHWLINLTDSTVDDSQPLVRDQVLAIFRILLYHAIRYEYGGWRVWIDTLAIIHAKVSFDEFRLRLSKDSCSLEQLPLIAGPKELVIQEEDQEQQQHQEDQQQQHKKQRDTLLQEARVKKADVQVDEAAKKVESTAASTRVSTELTTQASVHQNNDQAATDTERAEESEPSKHQVGVSSISERILNESRGIDMADENRPIDETTTGVDEPDAKEAGANQEVLSNEVITSETVEPQDTADDAAAPAEKEEESARVDDSKPEVSMDSIDLAPSRAFRKISLDDGAEEEPSSAGTAVGGVAEGAADGTIDSGAGGSDSCSGQLTRQPSMMSIPLEETSPVQQFSSSDVSGTEPEVPLKESQHKQQQVEPQTEETISDESPTISVQAAATTTTSAPHQSKKVTASPAFRIPEFQWGSILVKLLNDLMFSIECDLYHWRCCAKLGGLDTPPFVPKAANSTVGGSSSNAGTNASGASSTVTNNHQSNNARSAGASMASSQIDQILQRSENQIYIINVVHLVSQLADNIIIAAGGLLPLLADATGGGGSSSANRGASTNSTGANNQKSTAPTTTTCEGLTLAEANSLLYRLVNMVDMVVLAASHINLGELEADKNTTNGAILRQCIRLVCTVTVKNCLILRALSQRHGGGLPRSDGENSATGGSDITSTVEFPKDMFDSYHGCSLLSANGLFQGSALTLDCSDLIANVEYSPHQTPNTSSMPSLLPFQTSPIKDPNKLLQSIDISRIQACIYHNCSTESRQSQFLALSSLYFISVLMVSKYRDIIEPKNKPTSSSKSKAQISPAGQGSSAARPNLAPVVGGSGGEEGAPSNGSDGPVSSIEANLLSFGKMQPNASSSGSGQQQSVDTSGIDSATSSASSSLTNMLTSKLENTLDTVCPLLKSIMCDFAAFLSKTLIGSHGQDLVNKEAERTFKRANASPVELVMLLCSQEWQNTLQKNAGLAFIELINEGRVLSHGMKDHIVRVAMEAEFILSRLRADDVAKHEHFGLACSESLAARLHEEVLINSLISSAARRDYMMFCKFRETINLHKQHRKYKLDIWEDDDRRKRRFVLDSWDDSSQIFYSPPSLVGRGAGGEQLQEQHQLRQHHHQGDTLGSEADVEDKTNDESAGDRSSSNHHQAETKRILELQKTIELGGIDEHCSPAGAGGGHSDALVGPESGRKNGDRSEDYEDVEVDDEDDGDVDEEEEDAEDGADYDKDAVQLDSTSPYSDGGEHNHQLQRRHSNHQAKNNLAAAAASAAASTAGYGDEERKDSTMTAAGSVYHQAAKGADGPSLNAGSGATPSEQSKSNQVWDYDECGSVNDFTGSVIFAAECSLIWGIYAIPGVFQITNYELYFEPNQNISDAIDALKRDLKGGAGSGEQHHQSDNDETSLRSLRSNNPGESPHASGEQISLRKIDLKALRYCDFLACNGKILLNDIRAIFSRHYLLQPSALEIFLAQRTSVMFAFADFDIVKRVVKYLPPVGVGIKYGIAQSRRASLMSPRQLFNASNMTHRWQRREIGNFQYLMFLNTIAGRTYQDLNQYPVFPWILTNYESDELDINLPTNFRDLSKPVGALNAKRRAEFIERYQTWDNPKVPAFHYGTHYSTAAFTLNWLSRLRGAHNSSYLALQDGKYEETSRLFQSIGDSWVSSLIGGQQNVKELIPEFFYLPETFHANLGLPEVEYPPWAKSAEQFVRMHRIALESELVSCQLHQWIDLIFGYKQRGPEAVNAVNTFYYLTYQGNVNLNMIQDSSLREAIETQIKHFGQTPSQLTTEPHPPRFSALHASPLVFHANLGDEVNKIIKFPFNNPVIHISSCINNYISPTSATIGGGGAASASGGGTTANSSATATTDSLGTVQTSGGANSPSSVLTITSNNQYQIHKWMPNEPSGHPLSIDPQLETAASGAARRQLIDVDDLCSSISLQVSSSPARSSDENSSVTSDSHNNCSSLTTTNVVDEVQWPCAHYLVTLNGKYIIMGSFYDNSIRVFTTESGKLCQVIYGHRGLITCMARSEGNAAADFYIATGSQDCSLLIWTWNERFAQVEGSGVSAVHNPLPKLSICGHQTPVLSAMISAELGLIISGSKNLILVHTTATGESLLQIDVMLPDIMDRTLLENKMHAAQDSANHVHLQRPHVKDKQRTILEASMLGEGGAATAVNGRTTGQAPANTIIDGELEPEKPLASSSSRSQSPNSCAKDERLAQLKSLCCSDYYITNLRLCRELGFIVCVALPPPRKKSRTSANSANESESHTVQQQPVTNPPALLLTFNLKGSLMDSQPIGHSVNSPKLGDVCALQTSGDGEYLILNDSPITIKIYKTFGLQPIYAFNTNDLPGAKSEDQNRVKSLALLEQKYILVGLENGKVIVYNADFKNLH